MTTDTAELGRYLGTDPERWAAAFLAVFHESEFVRTAADRQASATKWFRDYGEAIWGEAAREAISASMARQRQE